MKDYQKLVKLADDVSYSRFGLFLYQVSIGTIIGLIYFLVLSKLPMLFAVILGIALYQTLFTVIANFIGPIFYQYIGKVDMYFYDSASWEIQIDKNGFVCNNGFRTTYIQWNGISDILEHTNCVIFFATGGNFFVPHECFESDTERLAFLQEVKEYLSETKGPGAAFD